MGFNDRSDRMIASANGNVASSYRKTFPLSPIQNLYMHLQGDITRLPSSHQSLLLRVKVKVPPAFIRVALKSLVSRHSVLRTRLTLNKDRGVWEQYTSKEANNAFAFHYDTGEQSFGETHTEAINKCRSQIDIENGPVLAALLFEDVSSQQSLFMAIHLFAIDADSWKILVKDLEDLLTSGSVSTSPTIGFPAWCELQQDYAAKCAEDFGTALSGADDQSTRLSCWSLVKQDQADDASQIKYFALDKATSVALCGPCNNALRTRPAELLVAALAHSFGQAFPGQRTPAILYEGHGRESWDDSIDTSRTVGCFTTIFPALRHDTSGLDLVDTVRLAKDDWRSFPSSAWPSFISSFASSSDAQIQTTLFPVDVILKYDDRSPEQGEQAAESIFEVAATSDSGKAAAPAPAQHRFALFEVQAAKDQDNQLGITVTYPKVCNSKDEVATWMAYFQETLAHMATYLCGRLTELTLADLPLGFQTYEDLNTFRCRVLPQLGISEAEVEDVYPCSAIQEGMLLARAKDQANYNTVIEFEIDASSDSECIDSLRIEQAWRAVVRRHSLLRALLVDGCPGSNGTVHVILRDAEPRITYQQADSSNSGDQVESESSANFCQQSDLQHHLTIFETAGRRDQARVRLNINHAIIDAESVDLLLNDFQRAYRHGPEACSPSGSGPSYCKFIEYLQRTSTKADSAYWKHYLDGIEPCFLLGGGETSLTEHEEDAGFFIEMPIKEGGRIHDFCTKLEITKATVLQAAWALVLSKLTGSKSTCFGMLTSGRDVPIEGVDQIFGPFISLHPCCVSFQNGTTSIGELLEAVQRGYIDGLPHQTYSLVQIQRDLQTGQQGLFNSIMSLRKDAETPPSTNSGGDHVFRRLGGRDEVEYDIALTATYGATEITMRLDFKAGFIRRRNADRIAAMMAKAIAQITSTPATPISDINLILDEDISQIWEWNAQVPEATECTVHSMIEAQVASRPDAPAVSAWDGDLTYGELNTLASRLVPRLKSHGVGPDVVVPLCFEKSQWTAVAALAVFKAGGAISQLDISQPTARLRSIIQKVQAKVVLCSLDQTPTWSGAVTTITVDSGLFADHGLAVSYGDSCSPASPVYVVFTSGTTGTPKGVIITHRAFSSAFSHQAKALGFHARARVYDFASYAFDLSLSNLLMTLCAGGCLCVPSEHERWHSLAQSLNERKATLAHLTGSVARLCASSVRKLEVLLLGGEAMRSDDAAIWPETTKVVNSYGPSECTPNSAFELRRQIPGKDVSIGHAVGCVTWVVDPGNRSRLAPIGAAGELVIEGPNVGGGYLHDAENTAASFLQDPPWLTRGSGASGRPGRRGRLYATGDLVRYQADGSLVFIGREDSQAKIRGQRVELGEVEHHTLACMPEASQVVAEVIAPSRKPGAENTRPLLAVFVVSRANKTDENPRTNGKLQEDSESRVNGNTDISLALDVSTSADTDATPQVKVITLPPAVEDALTERLPSYMIPAVVFIVNRIPVNASAKADRKKLRAIGAGFTEKQLAEMCADTSQPKSMPSTDVERKVQHLWAQVLNLDPDSIGVNDSFFRLGGDSLAAMRLVAMARSVGLNLAVSGVFRNPKLSALASLATEAAANEAEEEVSQAVTPFSLLKEPADNTRCRDNAAEMCNIDIDAIEDAYPCTPLQEGLLAMTSQSGSAYVQRSVQDLPPDIDLGRFRAAWDEAIRRLDILRTRIVQDSREGLLQVVLRGGIDWTCASNLEDYLEKDSAAPMGLGQRLARFALITEEGSSPSRFVLTLHHALYDGHFLANIRGLVSTLYRNEEEWPIRDFKHFVRYTTTRAHSAGALEYWVGQMDGFASEMFPASSLSDKPPSASGFHLHQCSMPLIQEPVVTTSSLIRAAWALTVSACSGALDVIFGATVSGRQADIAAVEDIAGPTIATVPVRVQINPSQTVLDYLRQVQKQAVDMIPYEQTGLQNVQSFSANTNLACHFQTLVVIQYRAEAEAQSPDSDLGEWESSSDRQAFASYALNLVFWLGKDSVSAEVSFDERRISKWQVALALERFETILAQLASCQDAQTVAEVEVLSSSDYKQLWTWNKTVPPPVRKTVHSLIEKHAMVRPKAAAVSAWDGELTYGELDELANRLVPRLKKAGVGKDVLVPLCFEKSKWMPVATLAVLKAGGAFVGLEPTQPMLRLRGILEQTRAKIMLCSAEEAQRWHDPDIPVQAITVDSNLFTEEANGAAEPFIDDNPATPESALYVIFTSGSTGVPKGVVINHGAFSSATTYHAGPMGFHSKTRVYDFASYAFDISVSNILLALTSGACLCVPSDHERRYELHKSMNDRGATHAYLTPSVARLCSGGLLNKMETVLLGGELMRSDDAEAWPETTRIRNTYGPAECSVTCTFEQKRQKPGEDVSIGSAIGSVLWVVNPTDHTKLVPVGVPGELVIEGPIVGRGYLWDEEKTAASFIKDPPWLMQGGAGVRGRRGRLYKTGDLVRYQEDGSLVFIARKDTQVKIRGQRVELGEVEVHTLACIPNAVRVAAEVITPRGGGADPILAAFVVRAHGDEDDNAETGQHGSDVRVLTLTSAVEDALAARLPSYMVPAIIFVMNQIPANNSGKTDRKQLRTIGSSYTLQKLADLRDDASITKRAPSTTTERKIQELWARVLNIAPALIRADDSFFHIGGDSISAMKLAAVAPSEGLRLPVASIFSNPRLSALALVAEADESSINGTDDEDITAFSLLQHKESGEVDQFREQAAVSCQVEPGQIQDAYPCTPLQEGLLAMTSLSTSAYVQRGIQELTAHVDIQRYRRAWATAVRRLPILRTRIVRDDQHGLLQVVIDEEMHWSSASNLDDYVKSDSAAPMALSQRLARYALVTDPTSTSGQTWFVWTLHHALYDGHLLSKLRDLVTELYRSDPGSRFATSSLEIRDFKIFVKYLASLDHNLAMAYWRGALAGYDSEPFPATSAVTKRRNNSNMAKKFITIKRRCAVNNIEGTGITMASYVRAAWALTLVAASGADDVVFGAIVSGRHGSLYGISAIGGPTIATVPVRVKISSTQSTFELLQQIQEQATSMIAHEQTGLLQIEKASANARRACQFQTLLVTQPSEHTTLEGGEDDIGRWDLGDNMEDFTSYALNMSCFQEENRREVAIHATFDTGYLSKPAVELLLARFESYLHRLTEAPVSQRVSDIDPLSASDYEQIWTWNARVPEAANKTVHWLVEERVAVCPTATAISAWDGELTYGELDQLASILASRLREIGVGNETALVPLCFEKSLWTIVSMLAVLKAGGAFCLLDPSQPTARLQGIVEQTQAKVMLCSKDEAPRWSAMTVVIVDSTLLSQETKAPVAPVQLSVDPESAAYVVFTSGSTGTPKGVIVTHRALSSAIFHQAGPKGYTTATRVFDFASSAFDMAVEIPLFGLASGACVCVPSDVQRRGDLTKIVTSMAIDFLKLTPSVARLIDRNLVPTVKKLVLSGEEVREDDLIGWGDNVHVVVNYGPAECSPSSTVEPRAQTPGPYEPRSKGVSIGYGTGAVTWVVDAGDVNQLVPVGAVGELCIEGPIVGWGYLHDKEKTVAAYINDPSWLTKGNGAAHPGRQGRLYMTGDLVRYNDDGSLVFVGRKDTQVKIRGQRVELGDIESNVMAVVPGGSIQIAAEVIMPDGCKSQILAVFATSDLSDDEGQLHVYRGLQGPIGSGYAWVNTLPPAVEDALTERLPPYMIPAIVFTMARIPVTGSGKLDRKKMRAIGAAFTEQQLAHLRANVSQVSRPPSNDTEHALLQIWARVLSLDPTSFGVEDSFFRLGGDSITAMQISTLARASIGDVSSIDILRHRTITKLAATIDSTSHQAEPIAKSVPSKSFRSRLSSPSSSTIFPLVFQSDTEAQKFFADSLPQFGAVEKVVAAVEDILPCSSTQEQMLLAQSKAPHVYHFRTDLEIVVPSTSSSLDVAQITAAWRLLMQRHSLLRVCFGKKADDDDHTLQVILKSPEAKITRHSDGFYQRIREGPRKGFYGDNGIQNHLSIFRPESRRVIVRISLNHAIMDGNSVDIILNDFWSLYRGMPQQKAPLYGDFIRYIDRQPQDAARIHWANLVANLKSCHFPIQGNLRHKEATFSMTVPHLGASHILEFCSQQDISLATLIKASWALVLQRFTGSATPCFGTVTSARDVPVAGIDKIFGPTMCLLPTTVSLSRNVSAVDVLRQIDSNYLDDLPHQTHPFVDLYKACNIGTQDRLFNTALSIVRHDDDENTWTSQESHIVRLIDHYDPVEYEIYVRVSYSATSINIEVEAWDGFISKDVLGRVADFLSNRIAAIISKPYQII